MQIMTPLCTPQQKCKRVARSFPCTIIWKRTPTGEAHFCREQKSAMLNTAHSSWKSHAWITRRGGQVVFAPRGTELLRAAARHYGCILNTAIEQGTVSPLLMRWWDSNESHELPQQSAWLPGHLSVPVFPRLRTGRRDGHTQQLAWVYYRDENVAASLSMWNACHAIRVLQENLHTKL